MLRAFFVWLSESRALREVAERCADPVAARDWLGELSASRRSIGVRIAGQPMWAAIEDAGRLRDTPVKTGVVIGFPLGASVTTAKRLEAEECLRLGADELDMVMNIGALKSGDQALVEGDIRTLAEA